MNVIDFDKLYKLSVSQKGGMALFSHFQYKTGNNFINS